MRRGGREGRLLHHTHPPELIAYNGEVLVSGIVPTCLCSEKHGGAEPMGRQRGWASAGCVTRSSRHQAAIDSNRAAGRQRMFLPVERGSEGRVVERLAPLQPGSGAHLLWACQAAPRRCGGLKVLNTV
ncbi:hypothetical protein SKAU_G00311580 [Synaphobranchus kaupii]|uniref:Uncharacterized protein n=1 Tax=Synaphobranchus kaupii TaxID=118154 RepID=A0A9Q1ERZ1_SYNKA|nr:hypothetical protein SKAU_G00311580 [Synaphobranchus kaupii]